MPGADREDQSRVTTLELFFDLVFVFAFTQVTGLLTDDPTWTGMLRALLVLAILWWAWAGYARLTNRLDPEDDVVRIAMLAAVASMLVMALALPRVFGADGLTFAVAYIVFRVLHLALAGLAARGDADWRRSVLAAVPNVLATGALLVTASRVHGAAQLACWSTAAVLCYLWPLVGLRRGWEVSPPHFVERFGLVILIALGESVVAIGVGAHDLSLDTGLITAALLGMTVVACLWWSYFDWVVYVAEIRLAEATGAHRAALARDVYAYLHSAMVAGIVLFAYGLETALEDTGDPLDSVPASALAGGVALYLLAHVGLRLRVGGGLGRGRPVAAVTALAIVPLATVVDALVGLAALATVCAALITYEVLRYREPRAQVRARQGPPNTDERARPAPHIRTSSTARPAEPS